jgi:hypothetical protein
VIRLKIICVFIILLPNIVQSKCFDNNSEIQKIKDLNSILSCLDTEIINLKKTIENKIIRTKEINSFKELPQPKVSSSITLHKIKFDLLECSRKSSTVVCSFVIKNMANDLNFQFRSSTLAFDEFGSEHKPALVTIADKTADLNQTSSIRKHLISKVPVTSSIEFNGIPSNVTQFVSLNLVSYNGKNFTVIIKNIAIN